LVFEGLKVPAENLLGAVGEGFQIAMATLDGGRIGIAAQSLGIAQRAFDISLAYAKERESMGKAIARHQAIQWMLADMACRIEAARLLTWRAAAMREAAEKAGLETLSATQRVRLGRACSMAKLTASEAANFCADRGVQIHGGYGFSKEYEIERLYRDARITTLYEGTSEIQRMVIAGSYLK
jgi:alkylation response protein AidB-like acyl-CoA dehydrogenase